jgi:hypothetical protein
MAKVCAFAEAAIASAAAPASRAFNIEIPSG